MMRTMRSQSAGPWRSEAGWPRRMSTTSCTASASSSRERRSGARSRCFHLRLLTPRATPSHRCGSPHRRSSGGGDIRDQSAPACLRVNLARHRARIHDEPVDGVIQAIGSGRAGRTRARAARCSGRRGSASPCWRECSSARRSARSNTGEVRALRPVEQEVHAPHGPPPEHPIRPLKGILRLVVDLPPCHSGRGGGGSRDDAPKALLDGNSGAAGTVQRSMRLVRVGLALGGVVALGLGLLAVSDADFRKLEFSRLPTRTAWQLPERVIDALGVTAGDPRTEGMRCPSYGHRHGRWTVASIACSFGSHDGRRRCRTFSESILSARPAADRSATQNTARIPQSSSRA